MVEATSQRELDQILDRMKHEITNRVEAAAYIRRIPVSKWMKFALSVQRYGHSTSNVIKSVFSKLEEV